MGFVAHILVTAGLLFILGQMVDGVVVRDAKAALFGALALGLANAFVRPVLLVLTLPVTILTLGLFILVVNAVMLKFAAALVDGFEVKSFRAALWGAIGLTVLNVLVDLVFG